MFMYVSGELIDSCVLKLNFVFCIVTNWCYYLTIANPSKKKTIICTEKVYFEEDSFADLYQLFGDLQGLKSFT